MIFIAAVPLLLFTLIQSLTLRGEARVLAGQVESLTNELLASPIYEARGAARLRYLEEFEQQLASAASLAAEAQLTVARLNAVRRTSLLISAASATAIAVALALLFAGRLARPLVRVAEGARRIARGDLASRVAVACRSDRETRTLAESFNVMAEALERLETERQEMIADIAHELRTPLTILQGRLESLQDGITPLGLEEIDRIHAQSLILSRLITDLRTLSLAGAGRLSLQPRATDLADLIRRTLAGFERQAAERAVTLYFEGPTTLLLDADPDRLTQVYGNLLVNALRHTPRGGTVTTRLDPRPDEVELQIRDTGPGFSEKALENAFRRFSYAKHPSEGRSGLGLAIVQALVQLHGGRIKAENHPEGGALLCIFLPLLELDKGC